MLGDSHKAQEVFHTTLREAALGAAQGQLPKEPFWLFREARWHCLETTKTDLQPESLEIDEHEIAPGAALQIEQLDPAQLGNLDFHSARSSEDRAGTFLSRRIRLPRNSRHRRTQAEAPSRDAWRRGGDSCRHGWTLSIPNNASYEDAAVIAPSTRPFELRAI